MVAASASGGGAVPLVRRGEGRRLLIEWDCGDAIGRRFDLPLCFITFPYIALCLGAWMAKGS